MIEPGAGSTIGSVLAEAAARHGERDLLAVPAHAARSYHPGGWVIGYRAALAEVRRLAQHYAAHGYGHGHRVALLLDNRPEHLLHKLALNTLGACCVPVNPEYRGGEIAHLVDHAKPALLVALADRLPGVQAALRQSAHRPALATHEDFDHRLPDAATPAQPGAPGPDTPASILYTSGTTGRPKGCVLTHEYELLAGHAYATRGGLATLYEGEERVYNALPLYHVNASILSFFGMLLTGGCQIQGERFQPTRFWAEVRESRATIVHYLGVVVPLLLGQTPGPQDREHGVRFGWGAGVEPQLHALFEQRFGFPLVELWGMTEMVRVLTDCIAPRRVGTRAFGRALPGVEVRVVDESDRDVPDGRPGEMLIRHSAATPRKAFFAGYLDDPAATEAAWRGGWFHTGDVVTRDADGMLHFFDRRKNIVRRSGENIAAAEVEAALLAHPLVLNAAVLAVADELREEEVMACVVPKLPPADAAEEALLARELMAHCMASLAYYKAPGWLCFRAELPTTGTQKIRKHDLFGAGTDPRQAAGVIDLRALKTRRATP